MAKHVDVNAYWSDVGPRLQAHIEGLRDRKTEGVLVHALALYSFATEHIAEEATRNKDVLHHCGIMLIHVQDVLRGLLGAQAELSPASTAALLRIALEARCSQLFIIKSADPLKYADRFARYAGIERLLREEGAPAGTLSLLSPAAEAEIRTTCPEWFNAKGKVAVMHWTAEDKFKTVKAVAKAVGLEDEYLQVYGTSSKYVHGSPLLTNIYSKGRSMGALANPEACSQMSMLAAMQCVEMLREATDFYGTPSYEDDLLAWRVAWVQRSQEMQGR